MADIFRTKCEPMGIASSLETVALRLLLVWTEVRAEVIVPWVRDTTIVSYLAEDVVSWSLHIVQIQQTVRQS